jgi:peptidoglycan/xylan/chitin deacetylase (PgdA/CDA1 family)
MRLGVTLALGACLASGGARADELAPLVVAPYRGDATCAISFTFDDGSQNQLDLAVPLLNAAHMRATFFIVTGVVRDHKSDPLPKGASRSGNGGLSWDEIRTIAQMGHEIANHSLTHPNLPRTTDPEQLDRQINGSAQLITEKLGTPPLTFCYPGNGCDERVRAAVLQRHVAARERCVTYGAKVATDFTPAMANAIVDKALQEKTWIVPMLHGVEEGYSPITAETLKAHLAYLQTRRAEIWIDTFANVSRYLRERETATLTVVSQEPTAVSFTLTSSLDPRLYTVPLTVVIPTPDRTATNVRAAREGSAGALPVAVLPGKILVDVVPGGLPVGVRWE